MMTHEDVDVSRFVMLVRPHHGMVSHLDRRGWRVGVFVDARQNVYVRPRRMVVGVPLLVFYFEGTGKIFHRWVGRVFYGHFAGDECWNVFCEANATHEGGEPRPYRIAVELTQQRGMMETDPSA